MRRIQVLFHGGLWSKAFVAGETRILAYAENIGYLILYLLKTVCCCSVKRTGVYASASKSNIERNI